MSTRFDPRPHLRQLENGEPYLDVKWRLHWLRSEHPEAVIETQLLSLEGDTAVCKATVHIPDAGSATAHASAARDAGSHATHIEQAENRAIGRALAALGYGAEYTENDQVQARAMERPVSLVPSQLSHPAVPTEDESALSAPIRPVRQEDEHRPEPVRSRQDQQPRAPREVRDLREARQARDIREQQDAETVPAEPVPMKRGTDLRERAEEQQTERPPEDVSWTKFWEWAKRRGYRDAAHLRELLGIEVNALTPGEVRARIKRYELDHEAPGSDE